MNRITRMIVITTTLAGIVALAGLNAGCSGNRNAAMKALRSEAGDLDSQLSQTRDALNQSEQQRQALVAKNRTLEEQISSLEREKHRELDAMRDARAADAAAAQERISGLNNQMAALRSEIAQSNARNGEFDTQLLEMTRHISTLNSSLDAQRRQVVTLEKEKVALAEQLQASRKARVKSMLLVGVIFVGSVATLMVRRSRRAHPDEGDNEPVFARQAVAGHWKKG